MADKEPIARRAARHMAPKQFQPIQSYNILTVLSDLRANDYARFKKDNPGGDYEQYIINNHKTLDADGRANETTGAKKTMSEFEKKEEADIEIGKAVAEVFEGIFLPTVNGEELEGWDKVKVNTSEGVVDFDSRSEIINRSGDWYGSKAATRRAFLSKYVNYSYEKSVTNKAGQHIGKVFISFRVR